jgi:hypothetical protein
MLLSATDIAEKEIDILDVVILAEFDKFRRIFNFNAGRGSHVQIAPAR